MVKAEMQVKTEVGVITEKGAEIEVGATAEMQEVQEEEQRAKPGGLVTATGAPSAPIRLTCTLRVLQSPTVKMGNC